MYWFVYYDTKKTDVSYDFDNFMDEWMLFMDLVYYPNLYETLFKRTIWLNHCNFNSEHPKC